MRARWVFVVAVVGTADCGSVPADVDAGAQDATTDDAGDACSDPFSCVDAQLDAPTNGQIVCPDAGYYFTINGDGDAETLSASFDGVPVAYFIDCCGYTALGVVASATPDGGPSVEVERASSNNPDGGLTFLAGPNSARYFRSDGTTFSSYWSDASLTTVFTQVDPPGGFVRGSYAVTVTSSAQPDAATLSLSGTFFTCRIGDAVCACPPPPAP